MIVIVDYQMGNLGSIANMIKKVGSKAVISSDVETIRSASKLILPGVGAFDNGMQKLEEMGLMDVLNEKATVEKVPVMGLCLGMQLLTQGSQEGSLPGLGWLAAQTIRFNFDNDQKALKIPHMGWNYIDIKQPSEILAEMPDDPRFYFVHSYHVVCEDAADILAVTRYGYEFTAAVMRGNILGMQFHPEKSHKFGMRLFKNFVERC